MNLNEIQFQKQLEIANSILSTTENCYINVYPRVGKTLISFIVGSKNNKKTYIVVPNQMLQQTMKNQLKEVYTYIRPFKFNQNIEIYTKKELMDGNILCSQGTQYDLIIDEIHKYTTDDGMSSILTYMTMPHVRIIGMTGTPNEVPIVLNLKMVYKFTEDEAIENNFIASHEEYAIPLEFNLKEQEEYVIYSQIIRKQLELLKDAYKLTPFKDPLECLYACAKGKTINSIYVKGGAICSMVAEAVGWNNNLDTTNEYNKNLNINFNPNNLYEDSKKTVAFIEKRNDLMFNNVAKVSKSIELLNKLEGTTLIFTSTKKLAELIYTAANNDKIGIFYSAMPSRFMKDINNNLICTKDGTPKKIGVDRQKKLILEKLSKGIITTLITPSSLQEGFTEKIINNVIVCNGSCDSIVDVQRKARGKTFEKDKVLKIYNLYFDDFLHNTEIIKNRDKTKFQERTKNINNIIYEK